MNKRLYLSPPHMGGDERALVNDVFDSNWIAPVGPDIVAFEKELCTYTGAPHAVALTSGTAALHLALILSGVTPGDTVLCSTFTFAGSVFPVRYVGAEPVFVDSENSSWNMDPQLLEKAITELRAKGKTIGAVIVVHLYGQSADIERIATLCEENGIPLIEDAAESVGGYYGERHTGTFGRFGVFSFNGNKIMTTSGGGMLIGRSSDDIAAARYLSTQAREDFPHYEHTTVGYNYRMSNVLAAIGRGQLRVLNSHIARREEVFDFYDDCFSECSEIAMMPIARWGRPNYWLTCIQISSSSSSSCTPEEVRLALEAQNIESRLLWKPMHMQPVFSSSSAYLSGVAEAVFRTGLCLPSGSALTDSDVERVASVVLKTIRAHGG